MVRSQVALEMTNTASKDKRNSVEKDGHNSAMHSRSSQSKREYETGFQNGQKNSYCVCQLDKIDGSDDDLARRYKYYRLMTYTDSSSLSATFHGHNQVRIHPFATTQHTPNRNIYCTFLTKTETAVYISRHSEFIKVGSPEKGQPKLGKGREKI